MKQNHSNKRTRTNAILAAIGALVLGVGLLFLSRLVHVSAQQAPETQPAATTPASESPPASAPASQPDSSNGRKPMDTRRAAGERMAGLLLLFGLMAIGLSMICVGWIVYDIRRSRPAWMTQTKYPIMEKKKHRR